jgi:small subunit ribosomal protein S13
MTIIRLCGFDLNGEKKLWQALLGIKGIGKYMSTVVCKVFGKLTGKKWQETRLKDLSEKEIELLEDIIQNMDKYGIPSWLYNARKEYWSGKDLHLIGTELERKELDYFNRLVNIKSYRGLRRKEGLKCRGQRTKSHPRKHKRSKVGKKR